MDPYQHFLLASMELVSRSVKESPIVNVHWTWFCATKIKLKAENVTCQCFSNSLQCYSFSAEITYVSIIDFRKMRSTFHFILP